MKISHSLEDMRKWVGLEGCLESRRCLSDSLNIYKDTESVIHGTDLWNGALVTPVSRES